MKQNSSYQKSFVFSLLLHVAILSLLFVNLRNSLNYTVNNKLDSSQRNVIQAVAVSESQMQKQTPQQVRGDNRDVRGDNRDVRGDRRDMRTLEKQLENKKEIKEIKKEIVEKKIIKTPPPENKLLEKKLSEQKSPLQKHALDPKIKKDLEHELQAQLAEENAEQEISASAKKTGATSQNQLSPAQMQGEVDKYKALIVQAISQQWLIPDDVPPDLSCELLIKLATDGEVLSVDITRSSGKPALDRSARAAVFKASPLPVPPASEVFDKFRELRLTVRPENLM